MVYFFTLPKSYIGSQLCTQSSSRHQIWSPDWLGLQDSYNVTSHKLQHFLLSTFWAHVLLLWWCLCGLHDCGWVQSQSQSHALWQKKLTIMTWSWLPVLPSSRTSNMSITNRRRLTRKIWRLQRSLKWSPGYSCKTMLSPLSICVLIPHRWRRRRVEK